MSSATRHCHICQIILADNESTIKEHISSIHLNYRPYECSTCTKKGRIFKTTTHDDMMDHIAESHKETDCCFCMNFDWKNEAKLKAAIDECLQLSTSQHPPAVTTVASHSNSIANESAENAQLPRDSNARLRGIFASLGVISSDTENDATEPGTTSNSITETKVEVQHNSVGQKTFCEPVISHKKRIHLDNSTDQPTVKRKLTDQGVSPYNLRKQSSLANVTSPGPSNQIQSRERPATASQQETSSPQQTRKHIPIKREDSVLHFEDVLVKYPPALRDEIKTYLNNPKTAAINIDEKETKAAVKKCLNFISTLDFNAINEDFLNYLGQVMWKFVGSDSVLFAYIAQLWLLCYKLAKHQEGELTKDQLIQFYEAAKESKDEDINYMPTKALMVLYKAHEVLGAAQECQKDDGNFLRFMLDEFVAVMSNPEVISAIDSDNSYSILIENAKLEIYQIIYCAFDDPTCKALRNKCEKHCSELKWKADWALAKKILPLLLPRQPPDMYAQDKLPTVMIEVISRIFKFVLWIDVKMMDALMDFCRNPPNLELKEVTDADGLTVTYSKEYNTADGRDPRSVLSESIDAALQNDEAFKQSLSLSAKCLYLICLSHHRNNTWNDEILRMIRSCLAISVPFLEDRIQASAWMMLASHSYLTLPDAELLERTDEFLFPYKLAIYLKNDFCDAHMDIATVMYQIRTRLDRFASKESTDKDLAEACQQKTNGMLLKCRVHFELAHKYNDGRTEIPWLSPYFLAKIAEKLGDPVEKVMNLYHQSAVALEKEGYTYPKKIHRTEQTNFEPLEIHYKVHSYAHKQLSTYKTKQARSLTLGSLEASTTHLNKVHVFLEQFSHYGVATRTGKSGQRFYEEPQISLSYWCDDQCAKNPQNDFDLDVHNTVHQMVSVTDLHHKIATMCLTAFETILAKFPHYKACYRLAKMYHEAGESRKCSDTLFDRLLFPTKKNTGATSSSTFFQNITEIYRNAYERSGSWPYHVYNIVHLSITSCYRSMELNRLVAIEHSLISSPKSWESEPDKLSQKAVDHLRNRCMNAILKMANKKLLPEKNTDTLAVVIAQLQDLLRKMKRENVGEKHYPELEDLITKYINRKSQLLRQIQCTENIRTLTAQQEKTSAPQQKRKLIQINRENLSKHFEEVLQKYPIERRNDITKYLNNSGTVPEKKKQLVVRILEGAGYQVAISPQASPQKMSLKRAPETGVEQSTSEAEMQQENEEVQK